MMLRFTAPGRRLTVAVAGTALVAMALAACGGTTKSSTAGSSAGAAGQASANPNAKIKPGLKNQVGALPNGSSKTRPTCY